MEAFSCHRLLFLFVILSLLKNASSQNFSLGERDVGKQPPSEESPTSTEKPESEFGKWDNIDKAIKRLVNQGIKRLMPIIMERQGKSNISVTCMRNVLKLIAGLKESRAWAFSFLDATGKAVDGFLSGTLATLGEYDQCINTEAINERKGSNYGKVLFTGKYCAIDFRPILPPKKPFYKMDDIIDELKNFSKKGTVGAEVAKNAHFFYFLVFRIGICVPSGCSEQDVYSAINGIMPSSKFLLTVKRCEIKEKLKIPPVVMFACVIFGIFGLLLIIGTIVDVIYYYKEKKINGTGLKILTSFSFMSNFRKLVNTRQSTQTLTSLNGIRVLSITWVILGHTYLIINYQVFRGFRKVTRYPRDFAFQAVVNATIAVDSFFFMGGLLVCYLTVKLVKEMNKPFNIIFYVLHRVWRLIPMYAATILIVFLDSVLGSGPIWHDTIDKYLDGCYKNWWTNLIFLNNYIDPGNICIPQSWYIACDMQLYLFSLIILIPLLRWPKAGISLAVLCTIVSMIVSSLVTYLYKFPPTILFVNPDTEQMEYQRHVSYFKPYSHAGPYFIGILVGYFLAVKPNIRFPRVVLILGWCAATICNLAVLYGVWEWNKSREPMFWETMFYSGCHRTAWALGLAWVVICCAIGQGGVVHYILTFKAWVPISRLTYAAYLIHPVVQISMVASLRMKVQPTHDFAVWMYFGHLMITYGTAFALSMLVEAPCLALEKIFLQRNEDSANDKIHMSRTMQSNGVAKETTDNNEENICNDTQNNHVCRL